MNTTINVLFCVLLFLFGLLLGSIGTASAYTRGFADGYRAGVATPRPEDHVANKLLCAYARAACRAKP